MGSWSQSAISENKEIMVIEPVRDFILWYMDRTEKPFLISVKNSQKPFLSGTLPVRNPSYIRNPPTYSNSSVHWYTKVHGYTERIQTKFPLDLAFALL